jgi:hypothetical protein
MLRLPQERSRAEDRNIALDVTCDCRNVRDMLEPAKSIIHRLGGVEAVAKATDRHPIQVRRWGYARDKGGSEGLIPVEHIEALLHLGARAAPEITASDIRPDLAQMFAANPPSNEEAGAA